MQPLDPDHGPDPVRALADGSRRWAPMPPDQARHVFREMVVWELSNGRLSAWRRRRLVQYAAALHLSAVDAGRLIQEAHDAFNVQHSRPATSDDDADSRPTLRFRPGLSRPAAWPVWVKLLLLAATVGAVELILFSILPG
ncbi:MAG: hypothetical protein ACE5GE_06950 [Phycisphaerae bacterium]